MLLTRCRLIRGAVEPDTEAINGNGVLTIAGRDGLLGTTASCFGTDFLGKGSNGHQRAYQATAEAAGSDSKPTPARAVANDTNIASRKLPPSLPSLSHFVSLLLVDCER